MKLVVVGGGIAGLAAAHRAVELARERGRRSTSRCSRRAIGSAARIATERADGFLVEAGPDSFLSEKPWALALCRRLGIEDRLVRTDERFRRSSSCTRPAAPAARRLSAAGADAMLAVRDLVAVLAARQAAHGARPRAAARRRRRREPRRVRAPAARARGARARRAAAGRRHLHRRPRRPQPRRHDAALPRAGAHGALRHPRAAPRAAPGAAPGTSGARWSLFVTFGGGMEELVTTLAARLPAGAVVLEQRVSALERAGAALAGGDVGGRPLRRRRVILATEAHAAARLRATCDPALATLLEEIPYASSATVSLGYRRADVPHRARRLRLRRAAHRGRALLACTFSSVKYPGRAPEGHVLLRGFVGGMLDAGVWPRTTTRWSPGRARELREALGIAAEPVLTRVHRWPASMPQYHVGHLERVETIERRARRAAGAVARRRRLPRRRHRRLRPLRRGRRRRAAGSALDV